MNYMTHYRWGPTGRTGRSKSRKVLHHHQLLHIIHYRKATEKTTLWRARGRRPGNRGTVSKGRQQRVDQSHFECKIYLKQKLIPLTTWTTSRIRLAIGHRKRKGDAEGSQRSQNNVVVPRLSGILLHEKRAGRFATRAGRVQAEAARRKH